MGDQLQAALLAVDEPLEQLAEVEEIYVRFVLAHTVGFDLIFAAELRSSDDDDLRAAGRRVIDLMMKPGIEVSPDLGRALELTEEFWTTAHGYATLFLTGFYVHDADYVVAAARRTARRLGPCGPLRTLTIVSEDSGRKYVIPDDPADRPVRTRRAVRVIVVGPDDRVLLFEDSDPGIAGVTWWVTPGGGIDPGETERQTAVREMAEETGYVLAEDELVGPLATRYAVHGYSDQVLEQQETFYLVRVRDVRDRHLRAHRGGADHPAGPPVVDAVRDRGGRGLDLAGPAARAVGPCRRAEPDPAAAGPPGRVHRPHLGTPRSRRSRLDHRAGTKVPALRTRGHWAGRSGGGQDGIRHRPTTEGE